jgi:hypothetical protein
VDLEKAQEICICPECPTYLSCDGDTLAFCLHVEGKSSCISGQHGCICGGCPVHAQEGFTYGYYCMNGSEAEQG